MNAYENQFVACQPNETVRLDREFYTVGKPLKNLGKECFELVEMGAGEIRRIKKEAFASVKKGEGK